MSEILCLYGDDSDLTLERHGDLWITRIGGKEFRDADDIELQERLGHLSDAGFKCPDWLWDKIYEIQDDALVPQVELCDIYGYPTEIPRDD